MRRVALASSLLIVAVLGLVRPLPAQAQPADDLPFEAFILAGPVHMWDDESSLGTAIVGGGGIGYRLGQFAFEGVFDARQHERDFASGVVFRANATRVTGRVLYYLGRGAAQPYFGGGIGYARVERVSDFPDDCRFEGLNFVCASTRRFESTGHSRALSAVAGVRLGSGRWFVRPEFELGHSRDNLTMSGTLAVGLRW